MSVSNQPITNPPQSVRTCALCFKPATRKLPFKDAHVYLRDHCIGQVATLAIVRA